MFEKYEGLHNGERYQVAVVTLLEEIRDLLKEIHNPVLTKEVTEVTREIAKEVKPVKVAKRTKKTE